MSGYSVKILADSLAPCGKRLTTWELTYPRFVHSELLTHRALSRNSASSRAIPVEKLIARVRETPVLPKWWGKAQRGMQAAQELDGEALENVKACWLSARDRAAFWAEALAGHGLHKQIANRVIEPWMFITVILSATEWDGWWRQRDHKDVQPELAWVAHEMHVQYDAHEPKRLAVGEWHLPLWGLPQDLTEDIPAEAVPKITTGRCARVSYLTHDGVRNPFEDVRLHNQLIESGHWSPFEHTARALDEKRWIGNFCGFRQYRADVDPYFINPKGWLADEDRQAHVVGPDGSRSGW
jgi:hypothetical protein